MASVKPALVACTACLLGIIHLKRRRKRQPAANAEPAIPVAPREAPVLIEPVLLVPSDDASEHAEENHRQGSATTSGRKLLHPAVARTWQLVLILLTAAGTIFSGTTSGFNMRADVKSPLAAAILAMGLLHVGALEAFIQWVSKKDVSGQHGPGRLVRAASRALQGRPATTEDALARLPYTPEQITGFWLKDRQRSDSMTRACDIMSLQGLMRHAVKILKGTRILLTNETFHVAAVSVVPVIKVAERYALTGEEGHFRRRDQRRGGAWGRVELTRDGVVFYARWNAPFAGSSKETFKLVTPHELQIVTEMWIGGETCTYTQVYTKRP